MSTSSVIALLTDFGSADSYVAEMKAAMLSVNPELKFIDISHSVPPGDIRQAAYYLWRSHRFFPAGTIFLSVVDPGVGSERRIVAIESGNYLFVAPDNGLLSMIVARSDYTAYEISNTQFMLVEGGSTFEGRDVMAPVSAHISLGVDIETIGNAVDKIETFKVASPLCSDDIIAGEVLSIDNFGNAITNISGDDLEAAGDQRFLRVLAGGKDIGSIHKTFDSVPAGETVAYIGSCGLLEIGINRGHFAKKSEITIGSTIEVVRHEH
ncbi:MAG: SAM-dependent chlorinase/fluorinase [Candidatus Zixiibacteriota bacterium]